MCRMRGSLAQKIGLRLSDFFGGKVRLILARIPPVYSNPGLLAGPADQPASPFLRDRNGVQDAGGPRSRRQGERRPTAFGRDSIVGALLDSSVVGGLGVRVLPSRNFGNRSRVSSFQFLVSGHFRSCPQTIRNFAGWVANASPLVIFGPSLS